MSLSPKAAEVRLASLDVSVPGSSAAAMACESLEAIVVGARRKSYAEGEDAQYHEKKNNEG